MRTEKPYRRIRATSPPAARHTHPEMRNTPSGPSTSDWSLRPEPPDDRTSAALSSARDIRSLGPLLRPSPVHSYIILSSLGSRGRTPTAVAVGTKGLVRNALIHGLLICAVTGPVGAAGMIANAKYQHYTANLAGII